MKGETPAKKISELGPLKKDKKISKINLNETLTLKET